MDLKQTVKVLIFLLGVFIILLCLDFISGGKNEGFEATDLFGKNAFCDKMSESTGEENERSCNTLTKSKCMDLGCCVWNGGEEKCVAGNAGGPLFNKDENGKEKDVLYYIFENQCYGSGCPTLEKSA